MSRAASPSRERIYGVAHLEGRSKEGCCGCGARRSFRRLPAGSNGKKIRTRDTVRTERPNGMRATDQTKAVTLKTARLPWRRHPHAPREFQQPRVRTQVVI